MTEMYKYTLVTESGEYFEKETMAHNLLDSLQESVGGFVETYPHPTDPSLTLGFNEDGAYLFSNPNKEFPGLLGPVVIVKTEYLK
jgi:hypothetical protein